MQRGISLGTTTNCEPPVGPAMGAGKRGYKKSAATTFPKDAPPDKLSLDKALTDMKEANKAVGGSLKGDEALAIMALLAREVVQHQTKKGTYSPARHLSSTLVSPPLSALRSRLCAKRFLEYATLCLNVYDLPSDEDWLSPPPELGPVDRWELLSSHKGGVCIPRHVVLRADGGVGTTRRRRTKRLMVVVRGTAEVTDAAINIAMAPGTWGYQGGEHFCHQGIVESADFLVRMVRPVIWRAIDKMKREEGIDPGNQVEVVFTGHSLGGAIAAVAALELQGEFGVRVPVKSVGFSSPASLSEDVASAPLTRKIITTVVLGDDMIPRCSTRNLQELKRRARGVLVDEEVGIIREIVAGEVTRRGDEWSRQIQMEMTRRGEEWTKQLTGMLLSKANEAKQQLPERWGNLFPPLPVEGGKGLDVNGLKQAFSGVLAQYLPPLIAQRQQQQQQQQWKTDAAGVAAVRENEQVAASVVVAAETKKIAEETTAVLEQALADYQATLDAEIVYVKDQIERIKCEALDSYLPSSLDASSSPSSTSNGKQQRTTTTTTTTSSSSSSILNVEDNAFDQEYDAEEEAIEQALLDANATRAAERKEKPMDVAAVQAMLQALIAEKASLAASAVKSQVEARVRELLTSSSNKVEEVKDRASKWMTDSFKDLHEQAKAALPVGGERRKGRKEDKEKERVIASAVKEVNEDMTESATQAAAATEEGELDAVALYPPGEIFYIHPLPLPDSSSNISGSSSSSSSSRGGRRRGKTTCNYELRRVRDVTFFDGIVLSPHMFTNHLLTNTIKSLKELGEEGGRE